MMLAIIYFYITSSLLPTNNEIFHTLKVSKYSKFAFMLFEARIAHYLLTATSSSSTQ